jgi:fermentation-respiration switch protein FrsA (DUF1100 family)
MGKSSFKIMIFDENKGIVQQISVPWIKTEVFLLNTRQGSDIPAIYFKNINAEFTLIYSHGNSTDLGRMFNFILDLSMQLKVSILLFEYTGYGEATGKPSEKHLYDDVYAAYQFLICNSVSWDSIVLFGQSIGTAAVCDLGVKERVAGIVLQSPLASGLHFISEHPKKNSWYNPFANIKKIGKLTCPVFIIHGTEDQEIPIFHGESLSEELQNPWPAWYPEAGHNDIEEKHRKQYLSRLLDFLQSLHDNKLASQESAFGSVIHIPEIKSLSNDCESSKIVFKKIIPTNDLS